MASRLGSWTRQMFQRAACIATTSAAASARTSRSRVQPRSVAGPGLLDAAARRGSRRAARRCPPPSASTSTTKAAAEHLRGRARPPCPSARCCPPLNSATRSHTLCTRSSRCEDSSTVTPSALKPRMMSSSSMRGLRIEARRRLVEDGDLRASSSGSRRARAAGACRARKCRRACRRRPSRPTLLERVGDASSRARRA